MHPPYRLCNNARSWLEFLVSEPFIVSIKLVLKIWIMLISVTWFISEIWILLISGTCVTSEAPTSLIHKISTMWTRVVLYVCRGKTWIILVSDFRIMLAKIVLHIHGSKCWKKADERGEQISTRWHTKKSSQKGTPSKLYMQHYLTEQKEYAGYSADYSQQI